MQSFNVINVTDKSQPQSKSEFSQLVYRNCIQSRDTFMNAELEWLIDHQILPTSTKRNVWRPVGRISTLKITILSSSTVLYVWRLVKNLLLGERAFKG